MLAASRLPTCFNSQNVRKELFWILNENYSAYMHYKQRSSLIIHRSMVAIKVTARSGKRFKSQYRRNGTVLQCHFMIVLKCWLIWANCTHNRFSKCLRFFESVSLGLFTHKSKSQVFSVPTLELVQLVQITLTKHICDNSFIDFSQLPEFFSIR